MNNKTKTQNKNLNSTIWLKLTTLTLLMVSSHSTLAKGLLPSVVYYPTYVSNILIPRLSSSMVTYNNQLNIYSLNKEHSLYFKLGIHDIRSTIYEIQGKGLDANTSSAEPINLLQKKYRIWPWLQPNKNDQCNA